MTQLFHPATNTLSRFTIFGAIFILTALGWLLYVFYRSPYTTDVGVARPQPVPFSHAHHVGAIGIDCRYCHTSVEDSSFANIPATSICMGCHSVLYNDSPILEPVRESFRTKEPLRWTRVHDVPDFVYFDHSIHVAKGVGCVTCHGQVNQMPLMWRDQTLHMQWCLECHRNPEKYLRDPSLVYSMTDGGAAQQSPDDPHAEGDTGHGEHGADEGPSPLEVGKLLVKQQNVKTEQLSDCSICHR